jgi:hypothetical protein
MAVTAGQKILFSTRSAVTSAPGNTNINIGPTIKQKAQTEIGMIRYLSKIGAALLNLTERSEAVDIFLHPIGVCTCVHAGLIEIVFDSALVLLPSISCAGAFHAFAVRPRNRARSMRHIELGKREFTRARAHTGKLFGFLNYPK